ncbi:MAG: CoA-transferase [Candidatus Rokubacteria bacterium]|nr:CoA-transferase [Candidatus Rokubacteria bacterium]
MVSSDYTPAELMVAAAAREIREGEVVFVGMRLPLLAFLLAKATHAPRAVGLFENGVLRDRPASEFLVTMSDGPNVTDALWCTEMCEIMALLQRGSVDLGFIGGAQVDRFGNLNTSYIARTPGDLSRGFTRLPGSGGACDIASLAKRHVLIMTHERRRFVPRVDYITSPGYGDGSGWRNRVGLPRGGPSAVITTLGLFRFDPDSQEIFLASTHPGITIQAVKTETGWPLRVAPSVTVTPPPTPEDLRLIRSYDPQGFWTRGKE